MKANPGGQIPAAEVLGRDRLVQHLWSALARQSLVLTAERRMGKTCLAKKMVAEAPPDRVVVYRDLEAVRTPVEFVQLVLQDALDHLGRVGRAAWRFRQLLGKLGGAEIARTIKLPPSTQVDWKPLLSELLHDLVEEEQRAAVLIWDEVPLMLFNMKEQRGPDVAMEVLDALRALRQENARLRMVFTGSIGIHNVIRTLRAHGYSNDPTNDMVAIEVPPLDLESSTELARRLLIGEDIPCNDRPAIARIIAGATDGIPYYIHHLVDQLAQRGEGADADRVRDIIASCLVDVRDPWHLMHFRERFDQYYAREETRIALPLLDALAASPRPVAEDRLFEDLQAHVARTERAECLRIVQLLERDHYVRRLGDGRLQFRFPLIGRWWALHRGITAR